MITGPIIPHILPEGNRPSKIKRGANNITPPNSDDLGDKTLPTHLVSNKHQNQVNNLICIKNPGTIIRKTKPTIEEKTLWFVARKNSSKRKGKRE